MLSRRMIIAALGVCVAHISTQAQGGTWTWIGGSSSPGAAAVYGPQGVPGPTVTPPALFDAQTWVDQQGNFWSFCGREVNGYWHSDMWKYDLQLGQWAYMDGPMLPGTYFGNLGSMGVPSPTNQPPGIRGAATWVDNSGDFWMFGGDATIGTTNMLWRYEPDVNIWTWVNGTNDLFDMGQWGTQGVAAPGNRPSPRALLNAAWTDDSGDLWLFGGEDGNYWADLWKYNVATNMWTWMSGSSVPFALGHYGEQGVGSPDRYPGYRAGCGAWRAPDGAFWLSGGLIGSGHGMNDLWRYDLGLNEWSWWAGDSVADALGDIPPYCSGTSTSTPCERYGHRTDWARDDGTLWSFGGITANDFSSSYNDLWKYCIGTDQWIFVRGSSTPNPSGSWGTLGVPAPSNTPNGRAGSSTWMDGDGNFYLFGGTASSGSQTYNDMWRYTPDDACGPCEAMNVHGHVPNALPITGYWSDLERGLVLQYPERAVPVDVHVVDASGRLVARRDLSRTMEHVPLDLESGVYWARVRSDQGEHAFAFFVPTKE